jgi:hypothetical protein
VKEYLAHQFVIKDLERLRYFLSIEIATSKKGIVMSQRKYALDILQKASMLGSKDDNIPMDPMAHLFDGIAKLMDKKTYRQLVGKLLSLTITRPDISLAIGKLSQFLSKPTIDHW